MHCIVGLGNPGREYGNTRHNIGFWVVDALAQAHGVAVNRRRFRSLFGKGIIRGHEALMVKPQIFMNNSGQPVDLVARFYKLDPAKLLVIYDDIALELGAIRLRRKGSAGGHRGMQNVIDCMGTDEVPRLRLGIGAPPPGQDSRHYVLSPFRASELKAAEQLVADAADCVRYLLDNGVDAAMNKFN
jgi:PTH1 family peptidyl-tRNA hydrolase